MDYSQYNVKALVCYNEMEVTRMKVMLQKLRTLRNYFLADESESIHWSDYAWLIAGYSFPVGILIFTFSQI